MLLGKQQSGLDCSIVLHSTVGLLTHEDSELMAEMDGSGSHVYMAYQQLLADSHHCRGRAACRRSRRHTCSGGRPGGSRGGGAGVSCGDGSDGDVDVGGEAADGERDAVCIEAACHAAADAVVLGAVRRAEQGVPLDALHARRCVPVAEATHMLV